MTRPPKLTPPPAPKPAPDPVAISLSVWRTRDFAAVKEILTYPSVYRRMADDFAPRPEDLEIPDSPKILYWLAALNGKEIGCFVVVERSPVLCEVHFCFTPFGWGGAARIAAKEFLRQLWQDTGYMRAIGNIAASNRLALKFAKEFGFAAFGRNHQSFQRGGKLIDEIWVGISRPTK